MHHALGRAVAGILSVCIGRCLRSRHAMFLLRAHVCQPIAVEPRCGGTPGARNGFPVERSGEIR